MTKTCFSYYKKEQGVDVAQEVEVEPIIPESYAEQEVEPIPQPNSQHIPQSIDRASNPQVDSNANAQAQPISDCRDFVKGDPTLRRQIQDCPIDKQYEI